MGCNQSTATRDSDSEGNSSSDDIPFEKMPFNTQILPSRSSVTISRPSGHSLKLDTLPKISVTNNTISPTPYQEVIRFPAITPLPPLKDESSTKSNVSSIHDPPITLQNRSSLSNGLPPVQSAVTDNIISRNASLQKYRTKKVTIYKPQIQTQTQTQTQTQAQAQTQTTPSSGASSDTHISRRKRHSHSRQTSKDDMDLGLHFSLKRKYRSKHNAMDPRLPTLSNNNSRSRLSIKKMDILGSHHMQYDLGCVTDIDDDSDDEYDNGTVVQHDSSANYESDDSYWDAQYISNRSKKGSVSHRRKATYHAYGGDDDVAAKTDSESGIGGEYDDELSDGSLNRMARIATGFNEDHRMAQGAEADDDETDIETAHYDHIHKSTRTNSDIKVITKQMSTVSDGTSSLNGSELMRSSSTSSGTSSHHQSVISVDKSSISMHQIDKAAFLQKILRNSMNQQHQHGVLNEDERMKKEKELKLQETHRTSNIKVIDDNTIAINIGMSKGYNDAPIPEGNEDEHYENQSEDSDTDTDPETALLDFGHTTIMSDETSEDSMEMREFKVIGDGVSVYQNMDLTDEVYSVQLEHGEIVSGEYRDDMKVVLLHQWKLYVSSVCVRDIEDDSQLETIDISLEVGEHMDDMDELIKREKEAMNKLKEILKKINESNDVHMHHEDNTDASPSSETSTDEEEVVYGQSMKDTVETEEDIHTQMNHYKNGKKMKMKPPEIKIDCDTDTVAVNVSALSKKLMDLNMDPMMLVPGAKQPKKEFKKPRVNVRVVNDMVNTTHKRVTIHKGKRRKKKRKKVITSPPVDAVSPRLFLRNSEDEDNDTEGSLREPDSPEKPGSPIIAKYGEALIENREQILQMIEVHKRKKKARKKQHSQSMTKDIEPVQNRVHRAQTPTIISRRKPKGYGAKQREDHSWIRSDTEPQIRACTPSSTSTPRSMSFKERIKMYQQTTTGIGSMAQRRMTEIKANRNRCDSPSFISEEQKRKASSLLQDYAAKKAKQIGDITLINKTLKKITAHNCVEKLEILGIITYIYVAINEFERWNNRNNISNMIDVCDDNKENYLKHPQKYVKMTNITLLNSKILIKLAEEQKEIFKRLILLGIECCTRIYKINFNAANITNPFLDKILKIITVRNGRINEQNERHNQMKDDMNKKTWFDPLMEDKDMMYGPELLLIENNPISDRGIEMICEHIAKNDGLHLKCLKVGHCFGTISTNLCGSFCDSLQHNESILKVTFDMRWKQHRNSVDKSLKQNYSRYRALQKIYRKTLGKKRK